MVFMMQKDWLGQFDILAHLQKIRAKDHTFFSQVDCFDPDFLGHIRHF